MPDFFPGFEQRQIETTGATINLVTGGGGPALLLLHGYPQTHVMWRKVAPRLAQDFTVVVPDLRGYGDSSKPPAGENFINYSKRALALDQVEVMAALGHDRFAVAGHDRGARVTHRLLRDHPEKITRGATLDIVPTLYRFETIDQKAATGSWHWFFLIQGRGLPEHMIGGDPEFFLRHISARCCATRARSSRRRGPSTCAASGTRRRSARPATNTAPAHPSTSSTTAPTFRRRSGCRCWCCGGPTAGRGAAMTSSRCGVTMLATCAATASIAATLSQRSSRTWSMRR